MGTFVQIRVFIDEPESSRSPAKDEVVTGLIERAFAEIRRLEGLMTTWRDDSGSRASTPPPGSRRCRSRPR